MVRNASSPTPTAQEPRNPSQDCRCLVLELLRHIEFEDVTLPAQTIIKQAKARTNQSHLRPAAFPVAESHVTPLFVLERASNQGRVSWWGVRAVRVLRRDMP